MKIGIISNLYPPFTRGGAEIIAAVEAEELKASWQHVFVISTKPRQIRIRGRGQVQKKTSYMMKDEVNGVLVYRFSPPNLYHYMDDHRFPALLRLLWHFIDTFNIFSYFTIQRILKQEKPDVIITHNLMGIGFLIPMLLRKMGIKHVHTLHDVQLVTPSGLILKGKEDSWQHKFFQYTGYVAVMKKLMSSPDLVISPSKFLLDFYNDRGFFRDSKKEVVPNPIKTIGNITKKPSYNLELLYLGQINKAKGAIDLIKNFKQIKNNNIRLHMVGVGIAMEQAKKLVKDDKRIILHGWVPHNHLMPILGRADVLVVPSLCYENSPTVIYEALNLGIPVLASDIGGVAELIKEGMNGWRFPAGDFTMMRNKIEIIFKKRDQLLKMKNNCTASVSDYKADKYAAKVLKLIDEIQ